MSNFAFLAAEFPAVHEAAVEAERQVGVSPTAAAFFAGKTVEVAVKWAFKNDPGLQAALSGQYRSPAARADISSRCRRSRLQQGAATSTRCAIARCMKKRRSPSGDAAGAVKELFHVCFWFARTYARKGKPADGLTFDASVLLAPRRGAEEGVQPYQGAAGRARRQERRADEAAHRQAGPRRRTEDLRAEVAAARKAAEAQPDAHDYNEAETRDRYIDLLLREAGWALDKPEDIEFRVEGMPNNEGVGFVDYVLWGADGKPLGLVKAKRTRKDARQGQQQAKLYADRLEARYGQRPSDLLFQRLRTLDLGRHAISAARSAGSTSSDELELLIQRRTSRKDAG